MMVLVRASAPPSLHSLTIRLTNMSLLLNIHPCTYFYCLVRLKIDGIPIKTRFWLELKWIIYTIRRMVLVRARTPPSLCSLTIRLTHLSLLLNIHPCTYFYCLLRLNIDGIPTKTRFWLNLNKLFSPSAWWFGSRDDAPFPLFVDDTISPVSFPLNAHPCTYFYCLLRLNIDGIPTKTRFWFEFICIFSIPFMVFLPGYFVSDFARVFDPIRQACRVIVFLRVILLNSLYGISAKLATGKGGSPSGPYLSTLDRYGPLGEPKEHSLSFDLKCTLHL